MKKIKNLAGASFSNGLRLHRDSIALFKIGSIPSSYALSILAQEEIGKAFLLAEIVFQDVDNNGLDLEYSKLILKCMRSHKVKQGWFSQQVGDFFKYPGKKYPKIFKDVYSGKLDEDKQNAIYVGVTKTDNKPDLMRGKIIDPSKRTKPKQAEKHITRVNDFIIEFTEGCRRGILCADPEEVDELLTMGLVAELESLWPKKSKSSIAKLKKYRKYDIDEDC